MEVFVDVSTGPPSSGGSYLSGSWARTVAIPSFVKLGVAVVMVRHTVLMRDALPSAGRPTEFGGWKPYFQFM